MIERYDKSIYISINNVLKKINNNKIEPSKKNYYEIINLLESFEKKYYKELSKNIKLKKYNYQVLKRISKVKYGLYSPASIRGVMMEEINPEVTKKKKCKVKKK